MELGSELNEEIMEVAERLEKIVHEEIVKYLNKKLEEDRINGAYHIVLVLFMTSYCKLIDSFVGMSLLTGYDVEEIKKNISEKVDGALSFARNELIRASYIYLNRLKNNNPKPH